MSSRSVHAIALPRSGRPAALLAGLPELAGRCALVPGGRAPGWGSPIDGGPPRGLLAAEPEVVFSGGLGALAEALRWLEPQPDRDPLSAVLIGSLAYELGEELHGAPPRRAARADPAPPVWLAGYRAVYAFGPGAAGGAVVGGSRAAAERLAGLLQEAATRPPAGRPAPLAPPSATTGDETFMDQVRRIQNYIRAGDTYQVNLSRRLTWEGVPRTAGAALFAALQASAPAPFGAFLETPRGVLLSNSPERFLRVEGRRVETRPIKGTRPRAREPRRDRALARELERSAKDRAEHVMIVDLERNDLGRVCETGSVAVRTLAQRMVLPTVHHLVSSVVGVLRAPAAWPELLHAAFPGGSITGAPKLRAMQIIAELEPVPRGPYTGAIGYLDAAGGGDLAIAIRTAVLHESRLNLHVGGGIVTDSRPEEELAETRHKARAFTALADSPMPRKGSRLLAAPPRSR